MGASTSTEIISEVSKFNLHRVQELFTSATSDKVVDRTKRETNPESPYPEAPRNPLTALQAACICCDAHKTNEKHTIEISEKMIKFLIEKKWDPSEEDIFGNTCLHLYLEHAGENATNEIVQALLTAPGLAKIPTPELFAARRNKYGETCLALAVQNAREALVAPLLDVCDTATINGTDSEGNTLIHTICYRSSKSPKSAASLNILREILSSGKFDDKNKNKMDNHGLYPLHIAAAQEASSELVAELTSNGFDAKVHINNNENNATPLIIAAIRNNTAIAQILLASSDKNFKTPKTNVSAISAALERGNLEMVKLLMLNGCRPYVRVEYHLPSSPENNNNDVNDDKEKEKSVVVDFDDEVKNTTVLEWVTKFLAAQFGTVERLKEVQELLKKE